MSSQETKAAEIMDFLNALPGVKRSVLYGSLAAGCADELSDIDINVDVSGMDNGKFMLETPVLMKARFDVLWYDFAPSLAPEKYVVSIAIDDNNPFCIVDLSCTAGPHMTTVRKSDLMNDPYVHLIKLWVANCKHYLRADSRTFDVWKMGMRCIGTQAERMDDEEIIEAVLCRLEENPPEHLKTYLKNCRKAWNGRAM